MMKQREIDLLDMLADMLSHWRGFVIAIVIGAVLMGGFSYMRSYQNAQAAQKVDEPVQEADIEKELPQLEKSLDDTLKTAVLITIDDEREYALKEKYLQNSVYMQLDPFEIARGELVYQIQAEEDSLNYQLSKVYENSIRSVGLYEWVEEQTGIPAEYVAELISVENNSGMSIAVENQKVTAGNGSLRIVAIQKDAKACSELTEAIKDYMNAQQEKLAAEIGSHDLRLVSEYAGTVMSTDVMNRQVDYRNSIGNLKAAIAAAQTAFTEDQKQYYKLLSGKEASEAVDAEQKPVTEEASVAASPAVSKKYVLLGAILFVFVYAAILCMQYIFNSRIRVNDELQILYGIPQIGVVVKDSKKKWIFDKWVDNLRHYGKRKFTAEQSMELVYAAVKIAAAKNGLSNICLMGCNMSAGADKVCESLQAALEKEGINVMVLNNVLYDAEAMEKLSTAKGVVLVEKAGSTLYNEIIGELELLKRQEIVVLGGITVE